MLPQNIPSSYRPPRCDRIPTPISTIRDFFTWTPARQPASLLFRPAPECPHLSLSSYPVRRVLTATSASKALNASALPPLSLTFHATPRHADQFVADSAFGLATSRTSKRTTDAFKNQASVLDNEQLHLSLDRDRFDPFCSLDSSIDDLSFNLSSLARREQTIPRTLRSLRPYRIYPFSEGPSRAYIIFQSTISMSADMATVRATTTNVPKLSFAKVRCRSAHLKRRKKEKICVTLANESSMKVAAGTTPEQPAPAPRQPQSNDTKENMHPTSSSVKPGPVVVGHLATANGTSHGTAPSSSKMESKGGAAEAQLVDGLQKLRVDNKAPSLVVNGSSSTSTGISSKVQTPSDDNSQKGDSSSDLGTKPPSLDGKSITSGTTFNALDEKESLRPDDSASVQAAAEDDDAFSVRGSLIAASRMGSEVAARFHRIQLGDMPPRSISHQHVIAESGNQGVNTPQSASSEQLPVTDAKIALVSATSTPNGIYGQNPDDKLLEAMQSQKDRLFLLKLEETVIEFVQDSK